MTLPVLRKELVVLWSSPLPYVAGAAFHAVFGVLVVNQLDVRAQAVVQPMIPIAGFLLLFAVPVLTMRSFAEEDRTGTLEMLFAAGVAPRPLVVGKWLAAWLSTLVMLAPSAVVVVLVALWGSPDLGPALSGGVGLVLLAATLTGAGVLASSLTASQAVAALVAIFGVLVSWFAYSGSAGLRAGSALAAVSLSERLQTFADGGIDTGDVGFFVCAAVLCLAAACIALDARRLR
ncbi:MAG TPA: ABC transporter permease subunit [Acidimicrobiales bacterium]|nr:ABC transporter permease subunit [Acidimicrobiales bacterium]